MQRTLGLLPISQGLSLKRKPILKIIGGLGKVKYTEVFGVFPDAANVSSVGQKQPYFSVR